MGPGVCHKVEVPKSEHSKKQVKKKEKKSQNGDTRNTPVPTVDGKLFKLEV